MVRAVKIVIWFPVLAIADLGEMADSYFASMSSPAITPLCKESKVCCPNSQCVPGLETFSGCKAERGPVRCDAAEMSSGFPLKNGICRCADGYSCETGKCIQLTPGVQPLPPLDRSLLEVHRYRKAAAMNWALLTLCSLLSLVMVAWVARCAVRLCSLEEAPQDEMRTGRRSEVQGLLHGLEDGTEKMEF
ncbi:unnamed protein product [Durusdinium trenchii]|uniref:Uncharacterized protein n=1 Tax=Durusdinium trenchii TaxID=1381693 RepID=A0ABP0LUX3_9DINO